MRRQVATSHRDPESAGRRSAVSRGNPLDAFPRPPSLDSGSHCWSCFGKRASCVPTNTRMEDARQLLPSLQCLCILGRWLVEREGSVWLVSPAKWAGASWIQTIDRHTCTNAHAHTHKKYKTLELSVCCLHLPSACAPSFLSRLTNRIPVALLHFAPQALPLAGLSTFTGPFPFPKAHG